jgi:hypothetical protein
VEGFTRWAECSPCSRGRSRRRPGIVPPPASSPGPAPGPRSRYCDKQSLQIFVASRIVDPDPVKGWIRIRINVKIQKLQKFKIEPLQILRPTVTQCSSMLHPGLWIRIRIIFASWIRLRIRVKSWKSPTTGFISWSRSRSSFQILSHTVTTTTALCFNVMDPGTQDP